MIAKGSHLAQASVSQGHTAYKRWCSDVHRDAPTFQEYLARPDVQKAYPLQESVTTPNLAAMTKAQLIAFINGSNVAAPAAPVAPASPVAAVAKVGMRFSYTNRDGITTTREILAVNADGSLQVRNETYNVISKKPWRGFDRQLAAGKVTLV